MLSLKWVSVALLSGFVAATTWSEWDVAEPLKKTVAEKPYDTFIKHFSVDRTGTDVALYHRFSELYPNSSITITQDYRFSPAKFASSGENDIAMKEIPGFKSIKKVAFSAPLRRRDGDGDVFDSVTLAGYTIAWKEYEFTAIVASWLEGYSFITQWHLIGENPTVAKEFIHACSSWNAALRDVILVFDNSFWSPDHNLWLSVQQANWKDVILEESFKSRLQHDYRSFFKAEKVYKDLEVPWKRGLIFLGPPGNGKTISVKAIMKDAKVPILYVKSFHTYQGDEFGIRQIFTRARAEAPCVLIMEDLDSLITDQNRSFFLNELDGLEDNDGLLLIGTTNHFDRLDPALSNRPSRFDRKYNFPDPTKEERRLYAVYWQKKLASNKEIDFPDSLLDEVAEKTKGFSFAYLKEAFVSTLITLANREDDSVKLPFREVLLEQIQILKDGLESGEGISMADSWNRVSMGGSSSRQSPFQIREGAGQGMPHRSEHGIRMAQSSPMPMRSGGAGNQVCIGMAWKGDGKGGPMTRIDMAAVPTQGLKQLSNEETRKLMKQIDEQERAEKTVEAKTSSIA